MPFFPMDKRPLFLAIHLLLPFVYLTKISAIVNQCNTFRINIAFVYDCRYNIQLQEELFALFLKTVEINKTKYLGDGALLVPALPIFKIVLMTYERSELQIFETLTMKNFTMKNFKVTKAKLNTSSCPQHLPLKTVFTETRDVLDETDVWDRKLAIFVLNENITDDETDEKNARFLETEQSRDYDVQRLFVMIQPNSRRKDDVKHLIYASTLENSLELAHKIIQIVCNECNRFMKETYQGNSCLHITTWSESITAMQAVDECNVFWPQSHLVHINSKSELEIFVSLVKTSVKGYFNRYSIPLENERDIHGNVLSFVRIPYVFFIGLSVQWNNLSKVYQWSDGAPFVVDIPLKSGNEGEGCVYMTQIAEIDINHDVKVDDIQLNIINCSTPKDIMFLICESDRKDFNKIRFILNDVKSKKLDILHTLLYQTFLHVLFNQMNTEFQKSDIISLKERQITYTVIQRELNIRCENYHATHRKDEMIDATHNLIARTSEAREVRAKCISIHLSKVENHVCGFLKTNKTDLNMSGTYHSDVMNLSGPVEYVSECLYEIDFNRRNTSFPNNSHLQDCEHFKCPQGFIKCPNSYCIPVYFFDDGVKDCPHGEDENYFDNDEHFCTGKLTFTLRNICVKLDMCSAYVLCYKNYNNFVCQEPCDNDSVCLSNTIRKDGGKEYTFYVKFVEITAKIYQQQSLFIFDIQMYTFFLFNKLVEIDLSNCGITDLDTVLKSLDNQDVEVLDVSNNMLSEHRTFSVIQKMTYLQSLDMSSNENLEIDNTFTFPSHLRVLDLSHTKSGSHVIKSLVNLTYLKILDLRHVEPLDLSLTGNVQLDVLDVRDTELINIKDGYLSWLSIQAALYTDDFRICCEAIRGPKILLEKCHAPQDAISTCQDLIGDPLKRVILWVVGVLSLLGNMVVIIYRIIWDRAILKKAYGLFVVCLGLSDFIMGVYLLIIAGADVFYRNIYVLEEFNWRYSVTCKLAGILSTFSSETSTMFICLITLDRYLVIRYPFGQHRFSKAGKITSLCLTLIVGVVVSVIPALFPGWEIYSSNGMCLALPFSSGRHMGWEYSAILFVGLNFILFILIAIGQLAIFSAVTSYTHNSLARTRDDLRKAQDIAVARQLFLVAVSDFCCWFPVGIMGIMSLTGYQFNLDVYAWSAVLILPVNSAINPLIYTLPVIVRKIKSGEVVSKLTSFNS